MSGASLRGRGVRVKADKVGERVGAEEGNA